MIDLTQYGFKETSRGDNFVEYTGHDMRIIFFEQEYVQGDGILTLRKSFMVNTKRYTYSQTAIGDLETWLAEKGIKKISSPPSSKGEYPKGEGV